MRPSTLCIGVGAREVPSDAQGLRLFDALREPLGALGCDLLEGGLRGVDLYGDMERYARVIFIDAIRDEAEEGVTLLGESDFPALASQGVHGADATYLLRAFRTLCDPAPASVYVLGVQGRYDPVMRAQALALLKPLFERP